MAPRILNLGGWRRHLLHRLEREIAVTGDQRVVNLRDEVLGYPGDTEFQPALASPDIMVVLRLATDATELGELSFFSTVTTFGTAVDITVSELSVEAFFPADASTAEALSTLAAAAA
jgi:MmyB-like transcription regulator ligand binding domain